MGNRFSRKEQEKQQPPIVVPAVPELQTSSRQTIGYDQVNRSFNGVPVYTSPRNNSTHNPWLFYDITNRTVSSSEAPSNRLMRSNQLHDITTNFESLKIQQPLRNIQGPEQSVLKASLFDLYVSEVVTYTELPFYDPGYISVTQMITNKKNFKVDSIEKIENPYLEKAFELKKEQKEQFGYVEERLLFHGTKQEYIDTICRMNFNWRLCKTHQYGKGISFSPNSTYASVYSDKNVYNKVMIVAKVLVTNSCQGNQFMELPPDGYDTTQKDEGIVIVKFEDNEFYPAYKINYHLVDEMVGKKAGHPIRGGRRGRRSMPQRANAVPVFFDFDF